MADGDLVLTREYELLDEAEQKEIMARVLDRQRMLLTSQTERLEGFEEIL